MKVFKSIASYYREINVAPPAYDFVDIRRHEENIDTLKEMQLPVRHELYSVSVFTEMDVELNLDNITVSGKAFIISPLKTISWSVKSKKAKGWYIIFDQAFIASHKQWKNFGAEFDFFKPETNLSFDLPAPALEDILYLIKKAHAELHSDHADKFKLIHSYIHLVLLNLKRQLAGLDGSKVTGQVQKNEKQLLVFSFQDLVESSVSGSKNDPRLRKASYYAGKLNIHPNYLNAIVKEIAGKTASQLIAAYLVNQAKIAIHHENLSVKQTAWRLHFPDTGNFISFFKKNTGTTPGQYLAAANL